MTHAAGLAESARVVQLIGHQDAFAPIRRAVLASQASHAYLFTGPAGVGRRTLALAIASTWNCVAQPADRPCGRCRSCGWIQRGTHPDVRVIKRSPDRRVISLRPVAGATPTRDFADNVEFIQSDAQLRPFVGRKKVYLVLNAEDLNAEAANRLLKTLEEPTAYVQFILTATDRGAVLPTILSRCQEVRLRPVPRADLARKLMARGLADAGRAGELAALAGGRPGIALAMAADLSAYELHRGDVRELLLLAQASRLERIAMARAISGRWSTQAESVRALLRTWLAWWRDVVLLQADAPDRVVHQRPDDLLALERAARSVGPATARQAVASLRQALVDLDANVNPRLVLDLLLLRLPSVPAARAAGVTRP